MATEDQVCYLLVDGDGHHEMTEAELKDKILDLVCTNKETTFKTTKHTIVGVPMFVIEAL